MNYKSELKKYNKEFINKSIENKIEINIYNSYVNDNFKSFIGYLDDYLKNEFPKKISNDVLLRFAIRDKAFKLYSKHMYGNIGAKKKSPIKDYDQIFNEVKLKYRSIDKLENIDEIKKRKMEEDRLRRIERKIDIRDNWYMVKSAINNKYVAKYFNMNN